MADTNIAIIHLSKFHHIRSLNLTAETWTSLKATKTRKMISLNTITTNLGTTSCAYHGTFLRIHCILHFQGKRSCCMLMHIAIYRHSVPNIYKVERTRFGCRLTETNLTKPMMSDLVRMRLFSQTTRDMEIIPQLILLISISKGVFSTRVSGQQPSCL